MDTPLGAAGDFPGEPIPVAQLQFGGLADGGKAGEAPDPPHGPSGSTKHAGHLGTQPDEWREWDSIDHERKVERWGRLRPAEFLPGQTRLGAPGSVDENDVFTVSTDRIAELCLGSRRRSVAGVAERAGAAGKPGLNCGWLRSFPTVRWLGTSRRRRSLLHGSASPPSREGEAGWGRFWS